jgi:hypothetical protein
MWGIPLIRSLYLIVAAHSPVSHANDFVLTAVAYNWLLGYLSHEEYQKNVADEKKLGKVIAGVMRNTGYCPEDVVADRGFDQSHKKQENCRRR